MSNKKLVDLLQASLDRVKKPKGYDELSKLLHWDRGIRELPTVNESPENLKFGSHRDI